MKKTLLFAALTLAASQAFAGPFLLSDPWPVTDATGATLVQPDSCTAVEGAVNKPLTLITVSGAKQIKHDLAGTTNGTHKFTITCENTAWGISSAPVSFQFAAGAPTAPAGFRLVP
jgi:hypothetical protein